MNKLLAGIDVGTTGVRCMLFDSHGNLLSGAYREYETKYLRPGWAEQDLEQMISQTMLVCREALDINNTEIEPIAENHEIYQGLYSAYVEANQALSRKTFENLAAIQDVTSNRQ